MKEPLISVVTICYNSEKTIETAINSMLSQTYKNYEYVIIDGLSQDRTLDIISNYKEAFGNKLVVVSEKDNGIYNAINKGINKCSGEIIGILNSDDYYSPNTLESVAKKYEHENYPLIVINGDLARVSEDGKDVFTYRFKEQQVENKEFFGHPSMFVAKAVYNKIGLYDETYKYAADGDWQYRAHEDSEVRYVLSHEVYNHMRQGGATDNLKLCGKWFKERVRMKKAHNKGSTFSIYLSEIIALVGTYIKALTPECLQTKLYEFYYKK